MTASTDPTANLPPEGCSLEAYAEAKHLPIAFLRSLGLDQISLSGRTAVRIPYRNADGEEVAVRFRIGLDSEPRFRWRSKSKPMLYGLDRLDPSARFVVVVEGESDLHTLQLHEINAAGVPGANSWNDERDAPHLARFEEVFVVVEPDEGGEALLRRLAESVMKDRIRLIELGPYKDPSELHVANAETFKERFHRFMDNSILLSVRLREQAEEQRAEAWKECAAIATLPNILARFSFEVEQLGVVGEDKLAKLLFLAINTRFFQRPVSVVVKGVSSGGKSYLVDQVLRFFPPAAYFDLSAMSERALAYLEEPLSHRFVVLYEAESLKNSFTAFLMRSLLSEGRIRYLTVDKQAGRLRSRTIDIEGPTGLLVTTTSPSLHPENETRMLSVVVDDTPEQTARVLAMQADETSPAADPAAWHSFGEWLALGNHEVTIPFAERLAESIPPAGVRLRRDFTALLSLIKAHAVVHQASRIRDDQGRVVATLADYEAVRDLIGDAISSGVESMVPASIRETVNTVMRMRGADRDQQITFAALSRELELDQSAARRRALSALERGYLKNHEVRSRRPANLDIGEPLPDDVAILPDPNQLLTDGRLAAIPEVPRPPPPTIAPDQTLSDTDPWETLVPGRSLPG